MSLKETLLAGFILAAVSALTVIAYKHPGGYRKMARSLILIGIFLMIFRVATALGGMSANIENLHEKLATANTSVDSFKFSIVRLGENFRDLKWTLGIATLTIAYLAFLSFLPNILGLPTAKTETIPESDAEKPD